MRILEVPYNYQYDNFFIVDLMRIWKSGEEKILSLHSVPGNVTVEFTLYPAPGWVTSSKTFLTNLMATKTKLSPKI